MNKVSAVWNEVRDSLWFVPALLTLASAGLAVVVVEIDARDLVPDWMETRWLHTGSSDGARGVLSAIASSIITVTGVVFSVTIVALQLASTQYTPRVLRNFAADRPSQVVLGVFIGTFTYALLVLRVVRGEDPTGLEDGEHFIPHLAIALAVVLALVSIGFLIFFVNHLARSIQASVIIHRVTDETIRSLNRRDPSRFGAPTGDEPDAVTPRAEGDVVTCRDSGYVQGIDPQSLVKLLSDRPWVIRLERDVGDFLLPGTALATVWPGEAVEDEEAMDRIRGAYILGVERTPHMDVEHGVIELVDIALKALSPSVNDPTTAVLCVDRLAEVLLAVARRGPPARVHRSEGGGWLILQSLQFARVADTALSQIRHFGAGNSSFAATVLDRLAELGRLLPSAARPSIRPHVTRILREAREQAAQPADLERLDVAGQAAMRALVC